MAPKGARGTGNRVAESAKPDPKPAIVESARDRVIREASKLVGTREATRRNDGPIIDAILDSVGLTIEGNTSPDAAAGSEADRNGEGIWRKRRLTRQIYSVRDWIGGR